MGPMRELVKNAELGCVVAAEGFNRPALDPFPQGQPAQYQGVPVFVAGGVEETDE